MAWGCSSVLECLPTECETFRFNTQHFINIMIIIITTCISLSPWLPVIFLMYMKSYFLSLGNQNDVLGQMQFWRLLEAMVQRESFLVQLLRERAMVGWRIRWRPLLLYSHKSDDLTLILGTYAKVESENKFHKVVLWPPPVLSGMWCPPRTSLSHTHSDKLKKKVGRPWEAGTSKTPPSSPFTTTPTITRRWMSFISLSF